MLDTAMVMVVLSPANRSALSLKEWTLTFPISAVVSASETSAADTAVRHSVRTRHVRMTEHSLRSIYGWHNHSLNKKGDARPRTRADTKIREKGLSARFVSLLLDGARVDGGVEALAGGR